jgi:hypothetical protein
MKNKSGGKAPQSKLKSGVWLILECGALPPLLFLDSGFPRDNS